MRIKPTLRIIINSFVMFFILSISLILVSSAETVLTLSGDSCNQVPNNGFFYNQSSKTCYYNLAGCVRLNDQTCNCTFNQVSVCYDTYFDINNNICYYDPRCTKEGCKYQKSDTPPKINLVTTTLVSKYCGPNYEECDSTIFFVNITTDDDLQVSVCRSQDCRNILCENTFSSSASGQIVELCETTDTRYTSFWVIAEEKTADPCGYKKSDKVMVSNNNPIDLNEYDVPAELACLRKNFTWFYNLSSSFSKFEGNFPQCCGDNISEVTINNIKTTLNLDNFYTIGGRVNNDRIVFCQRCINGTDSGAMILFGNGFQIKDKCYVSSPKCDLLNATNGTIYIIPGGGNRDYYFNSSNKMCYFNISCTPGMCSCESCEFGQYNLQEECSELKISEGKCYYNGFCTYEGCVYSMNQQPSGVNDLFFQEIFREDENKIYLRVSSGMYDREKDQIMLQVCQDSNCERILCNSSSIGGQGYGYCDIPLESLCTINQNSQKVKLYVTSIESNHSYPCNRSDVEKKRGPVFEVEYLCKRFYVGYTYVYLNFSFEDNNSITNISLYLKNSANLNDKYIFEYDPFTQNAIQSQHSLFEVDLERTKIFSNENFTRVYGSIALKVKNENNVNYADYSATISAMDTYFNKANYNIGFWRLDFTRPVGELNNCIIQNGQITCDLKNFYDEHSEIKIVKEQLTYSYILPTGVCDIFTSWQDLRELPIPTCYEVRFIVRDLVDNYYFFREPITNVRKS